MFADARARYGKFFIYGNHDLGHFFQESSFTGAEFSAAMAAAGVQILADRAVTVSADGIPLRIVGRRDWLFCRQRRRAAKELLGGPDGVFTLWLDHEPRELRQAEAAGGRPDPLRAHPRRTAVAGGAGGAAVPVQ